MKALDNSFSVIAVGAWNPAIFHGAWITEHLLENKSNQISISFSSNQGLPPQIQFEGVRIFPTSSRLQIVAIEPTIDGMASVLEVFRKIISLLVHTPLQSVGMNFGFIESESNDKILSWLGDELVLENTPTRYSFERAHVTRQFSSSGNFVLNLELSGGSNGPCTLSYNFDYGMNSVEGFLAAINEEALNDRHEEAVQFCSEVFDLELEEAVDD